MPSYRLSKSADSDVLEITTYTIKRFGAGQGKRYHDGLKRAFQTMADHPARGRNADDIAPGLRRWNYQSHVVFFRQEAQAIVIVRVLHQAMDPARHALKDE